MMIKILDNAYKRLNELKKKHNKKFVRLSVKGGGCAGFNYDWSFTDEEQREDIIIDDMLVVDRINELYLTGMELDYTYDDFEVPLFLTIRSYIILWLWYIFRCIIEPAYN